MGRGRSFGKRLIELLRESIELRESERCGAAVDFVEVTFQEVREHLGVETQRQWSDRAIARTTPLLLGLFSWVTMVANLLHQERPSAPRTDPWYAKTEPTFIDAIALVRRQLWSSVP